MGASGASKKSRLASLFSWFRSASIRTLFSLRSFGIRGWNQKREGTAGRIRISKGTQALNASISLIVGLVLLVGDLGEGLRHLSYDLGLSTQPIRIVDEAVVVYIDDVSMRHLGQAYHRPLDRKLLARFLDRMRRIGTRTVVLDIELDQAADQPADDQALTEALRRHGHVVLAANMDESGTYGDFRQAKEILPRPEFVAASAGVGLARVSVDTDRSVRRMFTGDPRLPTLTNSLSWQAAQLGLSTNRIDPPRWQTRWIHYYGPPGTTLPSVSFFRSLDDGEVRDDFFRGKIVLVGGRTGTGFIGEARDEFRHPWTWRTGGFTSGVEVHATMTLNLFRNEWLAELSPKKELLVTVLVGLGFGWLLPRLTLGVGLTVALTGAAGFAAGSWILVGSARIWAPWLIWSGIQIPLAWLGAVFATLRSTRNELIPSASSGSETSPRRTANDETVTRGVPGATESGKAEPVPVTYSVPDHELIRSIGKGGYGEVWLARTVLGSFRAAKIVESRSPDDARRLEREFAGIRRFDSVVGAESGFVRIYHTGINPARGYFYYVMELADDANARPPWELPKGRQLGDFSTDECAHETTATGLKRDADPHPASETHEVPSDWVSRYEPRTLRSELDRRGALGYISTLEIGIALATALEVLHAAGLVHRDIKPSNIIFVEGRPKLADIGTVASYADARTIVGSAGYLAPEGVGTPRGDLYSLGWVLRETLTGLHPALEWRQPLPPGTRATSPSMARLMEILQKATESHFERRHRSIAELKRELAELFRRQNLEETRSS